MILTVLTLLAAVPNVPAPTVVAEPNPTGVHRLQPRQMSASSFFKSGNVARPQAEPTFAADDDAQTAWVEGGQEGGRGPWLLWLGPALSQSRAYQVFIRGGLQKSKKLYAANARPRKVRLQPVSAEGDAVKDVGEPRVVELKDVLGWQQVEVPTPAAVTGVRMTVLSTYPGAKRNVAVSDLRVYADAGDAYRVEVEAAEFEKIRAFTAERRRAAELSAPVSREGRAQFSANYQENVLEKGGSNFSSNTQWIAHVRKNEVLAARAERAHAALTLLEGLRENEQKLAAMTKVQVARRAKTAASGRIAFGAFEHRNLQRVATLLDSRGLAQAPTVERVEGENALCIQACETGKYSGCSCEELCSGQCRYGGILHQMAGEYVLGDPKRPEALLRTKTVTIDGDRDSSIETFQNFLRYQDEVADAVVTMEGNGSDVYVDVLDWTHADDGSMKLDRVTTFRPYSGRVVEYVAAAQIAPPM